MAVIFFGFNLQQGNVFLLQSTKGPDNSFQQVDHVSSTVSKGHGTAKYATLYQHSLIIPCIMNSFEVNKACLIKEATSCGYCWHFCCCYGGCYSTIIRIIINYGDSGLTTCKSNLWVGRKKFEREGFITFDDAIVQYFNVRTLCLQAFTESEFQSPAFRP